MGVSFGFYRSGGVPNKRAEFLRNKGLWERYAVSLFKLKLKIKTKNNKRGF